MVKGKLKAFLVMILLFLFSLCFLSVCKRQTAATLTNAEDGVYVPIIMYHSLQKDSNRLNDYTISPAMFENDLKYLTESGYTTVTVIDLIDYVYHDKSLPEKSIMLTFDDGYYNNYAYAYPLLKEYNCRAVISPIISMTEKFTQSGEISASYGHINNDNIKEMIGSGCVEIQNHSYDLHKLKPRRGAEQKRGESFSDYKNYISQDITKAQEYIKDNFNVEPSCFVYPFGAKTENTEQIIKELGFVCTMTCTEKNNYITKNADSLYELGRYRRDKGESMEGLLNRIYNSK